MLAVPGPVTSKNSVGCHGMVRSGQAVLVTCTQEVLEALSPLGALPAVEIPAQYRRTDGLHPDARRLHDALTGVDCAGADELARDSGLPLGKVRALLPELELGGFVARSEGGWSATE